METSWTRQHQLNDNEGQMTQSLKENQHCNVASLVHGLQLTETQPEVPTNEQFDLLVLEYYITT